MQRQQQWTTADINQLLGLETRPVPITDDFEPDEATDEIEENENSIVEPEPHRKSLAKNPLAKVALIGGGLGIFFLAMGLLFHATTQINWSRVEGEKPQAPEVPQETGPTVEETLAALKTKAALAGQEEQLAAAKNKVDQEVTPTTLVKVQPPPSSQKVSSNPTTTSDSTPSGSATQPRVTHKRLPPRTNAPVARSPQPLVRPVPHNNSASTQPIDPIQQWQTLAQLGSYGGNVAQPKSSTVPPPRVAAKEQSSELPQSTMTSTIIPRTQQVVGRNRLTTPVSPVLTEEERFLSDGTQQQQQLHIGQTASAQLQTALVWETTQTQQDGDMVERFVVTLSTPLTNPQAQVIFPVGTPLMVAVKSVYDSGRVMAIVETVVKDGQEYPLPPGAMFLRGEGGNPLMATLIEGGSSQQMRANATTFMLGALSKTGELLNRGSTSTFISGGNLAQTQEFNSPNYIGGILEGGFTPLAERINEQHEERLSKLDGRSDLWMVAKGSTVEIFVNQTINF